MTFLLSATEAAAETAPDPGWLDTLYTTLFDPQWNKDHAHIIWPTILGILVLTGVGLPTPEDIWLTLAGFSTYKQSGDTFVWYYFAITLLVCSFANLIGDSGAWMLGRRYGFAIRDRFKFMRKVLNEKRIRKVQGWFDNYGSWTVFLGRQLAGIRFVTFFSAGTMRMPLPKFLLFDFLGCFVSIPVWLTLGALAAIHGKGWLESASKTASGTILITGAVAVVIFLVVIKIRASRRAKQDAEAVDEEVRLSVRTSSGIMEPPASDKPLKPQPGPDAGEQAKG